ncbi:hypothetical protein DVH24_037606 [Malus domestica]|uniref:Uncharacterized protein n=1 Tax=Malus domestica TaxID=3750 RepID=A0A498J3C9_MALDO|nr:hypothetical protein DVH24_037606 [Malus domestica]
MGLLLFVDMKGEEAEEARRATGGYRKKKTFSKEKATDLKMREGGRRLERPRRLCHIPARAPTTSRAQLRLSTILSALGPNHALTNSHENFPVGHPSWDCSRANLLNFGVPMEPETNELPKGLVLDRDENIHIRLTGSTPLGNVGSYRLNEMSLIG